MVMESTRLGGLSPKEYQTQSKGLQHKILTLNFGCFPRVPGAHREHPPACVLLATAQHQAWAGPKGVAYAIAVVERLVSRNLFKPRMGDLSNM